MKRIIALAGILLFVFACQNREAGTSTSESEAINAKSRAVYKAIETGDVSGLDSIIDKDVVDHDMGGIRGLDSVKKMLSDIHTHFDDLKFDIIAQANNGDYHFTLLTFNGTPKDNFMGMEAGRRVSMKAVDVVRIKNGKMVEHWGFTDNAEMMKMQMAHGQGTDTTKKDTTKPY
ncbi:MAG TPA: ester cyclase [Chitinophagaceae bacterium]|nr:ester cyclase [Chitinophagaceae bacterium]